MRQRDNPLYSVGTVVEDSKDNKNVLVVRKFANSPEAVPHIHKMHESYELLAKSALASKLSICKPISAAGEDFTIPFINGESFEHKLAKLVLGGNVKGFMAELDRFVSVIDSCASKTRDYRIPFMTEHEDLFGNSIQINPANVDLNFDNLIVDNENRWHLIDYEWCFEGTIPRDYTIGRALYWFFKRISYPIRTTNYKLISITNDAVYVPEQVFTHFKEIFDQLDDILLIEALFQGFVSDSTSAFNVKAITPEAYSPVGVLLSDKYQQSIDTANKLQETLRSKEVEIGDLNNHISLIKNSRTYKLAQKLSKGYNKIKP